MTKALKVWEHAFKSVKWNMSSRYVINIIFKWLRELNSCFLEMNDDIMCRNDTFLILSLSSQFFALKKKTKKNLSDLNK